MSTSIHSGLVPFDDSLYGTDDDPVDALIWRDGVANELLHCADSYAQVRVNLAFPDYSTFSGGGDEYLSGPASPTANAWFRIGGEFGPWPLTLHSDGTPYVLRVRLGFATSNAGVEQTVRVVIAPLAHAEVERGRDADYVYEAASDSATTGWITGSSQGDVASATRLIVPASKAAEWTVSTPIYDAVSSGSPRSISQCLVSAHVFAKSESSTGTTRLTHLYIAEYVGT